MKYNTTYTYLLLSSHSTLPQQFLNVATKSESKLNSTQIGQASAKNGCWFK